MSKFFFRPTLYCIVLLSLSACVRPSAEIERLTPSSNEPSEPSIAVTAASTNDGEAILFSYEEDGYAHLFAYIPGQMPITRLTAGDWDDIAPAASPDGKSIAFASNRNGFWDLYRMELSSGDVTQLTHSPEYEGAPSWSPDGTFLAYEAYRDDNLDILIGPANNPLQDAIYLTHSPASDHSPAWAPGGRQIAFISEGEVILADLDESDEERFSNISVTERAAESHPIWSPDGTKLAWASTSQSVGRSGIYIWDATRIAPAVWLGDGDYPAWNATGERIITTFDAPNETFIVTYSLDGKSLQPFVPFPAALRGLVWATLDLPTALPAAFQKAAQKTPAPLWTMVVNSTSNGLAERYSLAELENIQAPYPQLHDRADEAFNALRQRVIEQAGWDALASLENAFVPITASLDPGFEEDWMYAGRAFALNSLMTNAGWMVAAREDFGAQTYWRLYIRAQLQDGSLGEPLRVVPWDLSARYNLDPKIYEQGGSYSVTPGGYWVDVTALARQYGWERVPALPNWRTFFRGARFTEFAFTEGLDFYTAMLQLYPPDILITPTRLLPPTFTATVTYTPTPTATNTRTPRPTVTPSLTRTPTETVTPSVTPTPVPLTPTPPTIVP